MNDQQRTFEKFTEILGRVLPYYGEITKIKRKNILNSFEEVEFYGGGDSTKPHVILE